MAVKQVPSYYGVIRVPNVNDPLILGPSTLDVRTHESKYSTINKDSLTTTANTVTKKQNESDLFIPVVLTESVRSCNSEHTNTKNNNNKEDVKSTCIRAIWRPHLLKNRKIVIENDSDESERDEISNTTDEDTKEKELGTSNPSMKVYISCSFVWLNLSTLNSTKQKLTLSLVPSMLDPTKHDPQSSLYQTESEKDQYLVSSSLGNQFATDVKSDNKNNNAIVKIEGLLLKIRYQSSYEMLTEKAVHETCEFFMHSTRYQNFKDWISLDGIRSVLRLFQALGIFSMLQIQVDTVTSGGILSDKIGYRKVRYLIF